MHALDHTLTPSGPALSLRSGPVRVVAAVLFVVMILVGSCGGDSSLSCGAFTALNSTDQADAVTSVSSDLGFAGNDVDVERMRSGIERSCASNSDQQIGSIIGGFITALAD